MSEQETRVAFITAAVVLLVMPLFFVLGLASLMLAMRASGLEGSGRTMLALAIVWGAMVIVGALMMARRLIRRSART
jgi:hypothetical protein